MSSVGGELPCPHRRPPFRPPSPPSSRPTAPPYVGPASFLAFFALFAPILSAAAVSAPRPSLWTSPAFSPRRGSTGPRGRRRTGEDVGRMNGDGGGRRTEGDEWRRRGRITGAQLPCSTISGSCSRGASSCSRHTGPEQKCRKCGSPKTRAGGCGDATASFCFQAVPV